MMAFMMLMFGMIMAGISAIMPIQTLVNVPYMFRIMLFMIGIIISCVGYIILWGRAKKTGADHLLNPGRPSRILWFYVYRDGTIKITPSMREVEGQLYSPELDAQIQDMKSYRLFDHPVRFVPEGVGHAVDLGKCLYAQFLKTRYGFENMREARHGIKNFMPFVSGKKEILGREMTDEDIQNYLKRQVK
jgi:hypothetical protein